MVNDDNLLCTVRVRLFVCQSVLCVYLFILCVGNVKSHMLQDNIFGIHSKLSIS